MNLKSLFFFIFFSLFFFYVYQESKRLESYFIRDFKLSFDYEYVDSCKPNTESENEAYSVYKTYCELNDGPSFKKYIESLKLYLNNNKNSPILSSRPFTNYHGYFQKENKTSDSETVKHFLQRNANTEFMRVQFLINFMTQDCSEKSPDMIESKKIMTSLEFPLMKAKLLSKIIECQMIDGKINYNYIKNLVPSFQESSIKYMYSNLLTSFVLNKGSFLSWPFTFFFDPNNLMVLKKYENTLYFNDLSKFYYLIGDFRKSKYFLEKAISSDTNDFSLIPFYLNRTIMLNRLGKIYLYLSETEKLNSLLLKIKNNYSNINKLPKFYYPDMALPQLMLQKGMKNEVLDYISFLNNIDQLETDIALKWKYEIEKGFETRMEIDLYNARNKDAIKSKIFSNELNQIMMFQDKKIN